MENWLRLGYGGLVGRQRIVAVGRARSKHMRRLIEATPPGCLLDLTYGYPRESVVLLEGGFLAIVSVPLEELQELLERDNDES